MLSRVFNIIYIYRIKYRVVSVKQGDDVESTEKQVSIGLLLRMNAYSESRTGPPASIMRTLVVSCECCSTECREVGV